MHRVALVTMALTAWGCDATSNTTGARSSAPSTSASPAATTAGTAESAAESAAESGVEIVELRPSAEPLQAIVKRERAARPNQDLLIYVGAEWCEPCKRFHDAAKRGELDAVFPNLVLLELDRDADEARLEAAGCITRLIPLFARPTPEGGCDLSRSMTGSIKGPGAVANITPRLQRLLAK